jgi:hypothetical protein
MLKKKNEIPLINEILTNLISIANKLFESKLYMRCSGILEITFNIANENKLEDNVLKCGKVSIERASDLFREKNYDQSSIFLNIGIKILKMSDKGKEILKELLQDLWLKNQIKVVNERAYSESLYLLELAKDYFKELDETDLLKPWIQAWVKKCITEMQAQKSFDIIEKIETIALEVNLEEELIIFSDELLAQARAFLGNNEFANAGNLLNLAVHYALIANQVEKIPPIMDTYIGKAYTMGHPPEGENITDNQYVNIRYLLSEGLKNAVLAEQPEMFEKGAQLALEIADTFFSSKDDYHKAYPFYSIIINQYKAQKKYSEAMEIVTNKINSIISNKWEIMGWGKVYINLLRQVYPSKDPGLVKIGDFFKERGIEGLKNFDLSKVFFQHAIDMYQNAENSGKLQNLATKIAEIGEKYHRKLEFTSLADLEIQIYNKLNKPEKTVEVANLLISQTEKMKKPEEKGPYYKLALETYLKNGQKEKAKTISDSVLNEANNLLSKGKSLESVAYFDAITTYFSYVKKEDESYKEVLKTVGTQAQTFSKDLKELEAATKYIDCAIRISNDVESEKGLDRSIKILKRTLRISYQENAKYLQKSDPLAEFSKLLNSIGQQKHISSLYDISIAGLMEIGKTKEVAELLMPAIIRAMDINFNDAKNLLLIHTDPRMKTTSDLERVINIANLLIAGSIRKAEAQIFGLRPDLMIQLEAYLTKIRKDMIDTINESNEFDLVDWTAKHKVDLMFSQGLLDDLIKTGVLQYGLKYSDHVYIPAKALNQMITTAKNKINEGQVSIEEIADEVNIQQRIVRKHLKDWIQLLELGTIADEDFKTLYTPKKIINELIDIKSKNEGKLDSEVFSKEKQLNQTIIDQLVEMFSYYPQSKDKIHI